MNWKKSFTRSKSKKEGFSWWIWWKRRVFTVKFGCNVVKKKTWWKPGEIHKLGEITVKLPKLGENLVKFRNLVKTGWKLREIFKPGENFVKYINLVKTWWKLGEFQKLGENLVKNINLVKTWWKLGEFQKLGEKLGLGENLVNFLNLVKSWWISQTWWKFSETSNNSINFVKKCRKQNKNC